MYRYQSQQGYSLIEVLIAVAVLLLSIVGPLTIAAKSLQTASDSTDQMVATYLAQEGVEAIMALRQHSVIAAVKDNNFSQAWNWTGDSRLNDCRTSAGCNFDTNYQINLGNSSFRDSITSCANASDCQLSGDFDRYTRVVQLQNLGPDAVEVITTVSWTGRAFSGSNREVVIRTVLYDIYGEL